MKITVTKGRNAANTGKSFDLGLIEKETTGLNARVTFKNTLKIGRETFHVVVNRGEERLDREGKPYISKASAYLCNTILSKTGNTRTTYFDEIVITEG